MTKEQLINEIQDKVASPPDPIELHPRQVWYDREMKEAIVLAYNKGIEYAVGKFVEEAYYITSTQADLLMEILESLKIK